MQRTGLIPLLPSRPSRWRAALAVAALVLAAHALLLGRAPLLPGPEPRVDGWRPLQVRQIAMAPRPTVADAVPDAVPATAVAATPALAPARAALPSPPDAGGDTPLPAYATQLPPAATLRYALRRGGIQGQAELRWRPDDGRYLLALDSVGPGGQPVGSVSLGSLDASGIAPARYTEGRRGREARAVNFQHEAGRITFSGPSSDHPLQAGAQDRLSWMLQLPAVMEAAPTLRQPGTEVQMFVVGTRGDAEVWVFTVQGREIVDAPIGPVAGALHLRRQPRRPYDTQVDVWLDPARHHLPVRLQLQMQPAGSGTELVLEQHTTP